MKNIGFFYLKIFLFMVIKFSIYLNKRVFVMNFWTYMLPLSVSGRLCSVTVALPGHLPYYVQRIT